MTISVEPAATRAELATFLAIGAEVHPGPWPDAGALEYELATEPRTRFLLASLDGVPVASGVGKLSSIGDALYTMVRVFPATDSAGWQPPFSPSSPATRRRSIADRCSAACARTMQPRCVSSSTAASSSSRGSARSRST